MRLPKELIKHIADAIAAVLENKGMVKYAVSKAVISTTVAQVITENMIAEDTLKKEVEKLLSAHEDEIAKGNMDYRKVFELTMQKLAKEKGIVL